MRISHGDSPGSAHHGPSFLGTVIIAVLLVGCTGASVSAPACPLNVPRTGYSAGFRVVDLNCTAGGRDVPLTVAVWYPTLAPEEEHDYAGAASGRVAVDAAPCAEGGPYPLLVFSHGFGGSGLGAVFFAEELARRGWIVAAPDHHDRYSMVRIRGGSEENFQGLMVLRYAKKLTNYGPADRGEFDYRLDEIACALNGLQESKALGSMIDGKRISVGGHSLGAFTALGLCGTIPDRHERRIKAVLLFSSGAAVYLFTEDEIASVRIPSMYLFGSREKNRKRGKRSMGELADVLYALLPPPTYLLEVKGAGHLSFNSGPTPWPFRGSEEQFEVIRRYSISFLETYAAGRNDAAGVLDRQDPMLDRYVRKLPEPP